MDIDDAGRAIEPGSREYLMGVLAARMVWSMRENRPATIHLDPFYVQWAPGGPGLQVEVVADTYLPQDRRIGRFGARRLAELGFIKPGEEYPNWTMWLEHEVHAMQVAEALAVAVLDVLRVPLDVAVEHAGSVPEGEPVRHRSVEGIPLVPVLRRLSQSENADDLDPPDSPAVEDPAGDALLDLAATAQLVEAMGRAVRLAIREGDLDLALRAAQGVAALGAAQRDALPPGRRGEPAADLPPGTVTARLDAEAYFSVVRLVGEAFGWVGTRQGGWWLDDDGGDATALGWAGGYLTLPPPALLPEPDGQRAVHLYGMPWVRLDQRALHVHLTLASTDRQLQAWDWQTTTTGYEAVAESGFVAGHEVGHRARLVRVGLPQGAKSGPVFRFPLCTVCHRDALDALDGLDPVRRTVHVYESPPRVGDGMREVVATIRPRLDETVVEGIDDVVEQVRNPDPDSSQAFIRRDLVAVIDPGRPHLFTGVEQGDPYRCAACTRDYAHAIHTGLVLEHLAGQHPVEFRHVLDRRAVAVDPATELDLFVNWRLQEDPSEDVGAAPAFTALRRAAADPTASPDLLCRVAEEPLGEGTRLQLANNPNLPTAALRRLARDRSREVREAALRVWRDRLEREVPQAEPSKPWRLFHVWDMPSGRLAARVLLQAPDDPERLPEVEIIPERNPVGRVFLYGLGQDDAPTNDETASWERQRRRRNDQAAKRLHQVRKEVARRDNLRSLSAEALALEIAVPTIHRFVEDPTSFDGDRWMLDWCEANRER